MFLLKILIFISFAGICCLIIAGISEFDSKPPVSIDNSPPPDKFTIEYERIFGECYGLCPVYKVTINEKGEVVFEGKENVRKRGGHKSKISEEELNKLINKFEEVKFFRLFDKYVMSENCSKQILSDGDYARISFDNGKVSKSILRYSGCYGPGVFDDLKSLEDLIDQVANTKQWID